MIFYDLHDFDSIPSKSQEKEENMILDWLRKFKKISELLPEVRNYWSVFTSQLKPNSLQVYQIYSCTLQLNAQILKNVQQQTK